MIKLFLSLNHRLRQSVGTLIMSCSVLIMVPAGTAVCSPRLCAAIQGNGDAIFGHFHSLAHVISYYGLVDAAAGSSSATLTMFFLESMLQNPAVQDSHLSPQERADRVSLMLKSTVGFFEKRPGRREAMALYAFVNDLKSLKNHLPTTSPLSGLPEGDAIDFAHFQTVLGELFNPRFEQLLLQSPNLSFHLDDYRHALSLGAFKVDSNRVFLRPFPVSFEGIATVIGWIGNFYAARDYNNVDHWERWFQACRPETLREKTWGSIAFSDYDVNDVGGFLKKKEPSATACKVEFDQLMQDYRFQNKSPRATDRVNDTVGKYLETFPVTGILTGGGVGKIEAAKRAYWNAEPVINLGLDYDREFRVGYFGSKEGLETVGANVRRAAEEDRLDSKTRKFFPLAGFTWRDVFQTSPAEPSISEAAELVPGKIVSVGGWADPFPSTVLKMAGCQKTFFITAQRDEYRLVNGLNALLGGKGNYAGEALDQGLADADAVWCTNWHSFSDYLKSENVYRLSDATFATGLESSDPFFLDHFLAKPPTVRRPACNRL